jgi:type II secretory pathway predicted ATPase ExeA
MTLTFQLLEKLQRTSRTVFLFQTQCNSRELFRYVLNDLGVDASGMDMVSMHNKLKEILSRERLPGCRFVLAIDEAQNLDPSVLETIRLLSNSETSRNKLLQILLIGQPQLARKVASPDQVQLQQRISVFARLEPFGSEGGGFAILRTVCRSLAMAEARCSHWGHCRSSRIDRKESPSTSTGCASARFR